MCECNRCTCVRDPELPVGPALSGAMNEVRGSPDGTLLLDLPGVRTTVVTSVDGGSLPEGRPARGSLSRPVAGQSRTSKLDPFKPY
ncbi:hypothetical protein OEIGOIKO_00528 [Streptomyces chrestomyceticus JCM 4735]|uniref:Uncharacterized protein n=1 Tax=Streptomyces chrestomyceticus JCM 4735 TaxID=1306181 RepID=A0A7U9PVR5_9ACTN|nr:hypothetical protein OEIGOIKO_00528 [Streptomyces chrestomyceticus JCM 4735]